MHRAKAALITLAIVGCLTISGCGKSVDGKYQSANGMFGVDFSGGKAHLQIPTGTVDTDYSVSGDKVTLHYEGKDMVLTRNSDGSLESPEMGKLTKQQ